MRGDPQGLADPGDLAQGPGEVEEVLFLHVRPGSLQAGHDSAHPTGHCARTLARPSTAWSLYVLSSLWGFPSPDVLVLE